MELTQEQVDAMIEDNKKQKEQIEEMIKNQDSSGRLSEIISDPDVRMILDAKERGEDVRVVMRDDENRGNENENENKDLTRDDIDDMSNSELIHMMSSSFTDKISDALKEGLGPVHERLKSLDSKEDKEKSLSLQLQIDKARKDYTDFDDFKETILELHTDSPRLSVNELYSLARIREGKGVYEPSNTDSEKPSRSTAKLDGMKLKEKKIPKGEQGRMELLDRVDDMESLDQLLEQGGVKD